MVSGRWPGFKWLMRFYRCIWVFMGRNPSAKGAKGRKEEKEEREEHNERKRERDQKEETFLEASLAMITCVID